MRAPLPEVALSAPWPAQFLSWKANRGVLTLPLRNDDGTEVMAELQCCVSGRLRHAYPASRHDVEIQISDTRSTSLVTEILSAMSTAILTADPQCRKVVYVVDDVATDLCLMPIDLIGAAEAAGFRFVMEVDVADARLSLLVAEPDWVTQVDIDLDRVPGT